MSPKGILVSLQICASLTLFMHLMPAVEKPGLFCISCGLEVCQMFKC